MDPSKHIGKFNLVKRRGRGRWFQAIGVTSLHLLFHFYFLLMFKAIPPMNFACFSFKVMQFFYGLKQKKEQVERRNGE